MTCIRDRPRRWSWVIAAALAGVGLCGAGPGGADASGAANLLHDGRAALARGDGVAAEVALRKALAGGLPRAAVAARMGEALLDQGDLRGARAWLGPVQFAPQEAAHGWRMLGRLELAERNLAAAARAFDQALALAPRDSLVWVDIARLRYLGGDQVQAIAAADKAVELNPGNPRALELRGLLVRDSFGLLAALPWFERGLQLAPDDLGLLGEYAATLGELGRARDMLTITRRMIALDPHNSRAFLLQAILAARARNAPLARSVLAKAGPDAQASPAGLLVGGIVELESGNPHQAVDLFDRLVQRQPENARAQLLLARALAAAGSDAELIARFGEAAYRAEASPYLLTLAGRAYENRGLREAAALLLDRAAQGGKAGVTIPPGGAPPVAALRGWIAAGNVGAAGAEVARLRNAAPGAIDGLLAAGDVAFARGDLPAAIAAYRQAAAVRMTDALLQRLVLCLQRSGEIAQARQLVAAFRGGRPGDLLALRLEAGLAAAAGDWSRADAALSFLAKAALGRDARLQADLAFARLRAGNAPAAGEAAEAAYRLQRSAMIATRALAMAAAGPRGPSNDLAAKAAALEATGGT